MQKYNKCILKNKAETKFTKNIDFKSFMLYNSSKLDVWQFEMK